MYSSTLGRNWYYHLYIHITGDTRQRSSSATVLQAGRSRVQDPMSRINFFNLPNASSRTRTWDLLSHQET
jgi:hypothetical protein